MTLKQRRTAQERRHPVTARHDAPESGRVGARASGRERLDARQPEACPPGTGRPQAAQSELAEAIAFGTPFPAGTAAAIEHVWAHVARTWKWLQAQQHRRRHDRRLQVSETVSLGDKRFVSILQVDGAQFLIGGTSGNVSLLATLDRTQDFSSLLVPHTGAPEQP